MTTMSSSFRFQDKGEPQWPSSQSPYDQLFEQYIDSDPFELSSDNTADRSGSDDFANFLDVPECLSESGQGSPKSHGGDAAPKAQASGSSNAAISRLFGASDPESSYNKHLRGTDGGDPEKEDSTKGTGKAAKQSAHSLLSGITKGLRKSISIPKMAQPSFSRRGNQGAWAQKLEKNAESFDIKYQTGSGSPSAGNQEHIVDQSGRSMPNFSRPMSYQCPTSAAPGMVSQQSQPKSMRSPKYDQAGFQPGHHRRATQTPIAPYFNEGLSPSAFGSFTSAELQSASVWDNSQTNPFEFSLDAAMASEANDSKVQPWWPPAVPSANGFMQQQQHDQQHNQQHRQSRHHSHQSHSYVPVFNGNSTSFDANDTATFGMNGLMLNTHFQPTPTSHPQQLQRLHNPNTQFSPSPQTPSPQRRQRTCRHPGRTSSPSSANPRTPRSARRGSRNSSASRSQSRHRRSKSATVTNPKMPIAHHGSSASSSTACAHLQRASSHHHHHRHHSASVNLHNNGSARNIGSHRRARHHSSPSHSSVDPTVAGSSHTPSASNGNSSISFQNYTPSDAAKINAGVAPSGSAKTKANREKRAAEHERKLRQDAAERERRLSQAAARAVMEAGGDISALKREGL